MKKNKIITIVTLIISLALVAVTPIYIIDCIQNYTALLTNPATDGIDFIMTPQIYGMFLILPSIAGSTSSGLCIKFSQSKAAKIISYITLAFFTLCFMASLVVWLY